MRQSFKGTVVNRALTYLHKGLLEIILAAPLIKVKYIQIRKELTEFLPQNRNFYPCIFASQFCRPFIFQTQQTETRVKLDFCLPEVEF